MHFDRLRHFDYTECNSEELLSIIHKIYSHLHSTRLFFEEWIWSSPQTERTMQTSFEEQTSVRTEWTLFCCRCFCLVAKSCPTLCDPMDCSTPDFPVLHYLPKFAQTHVHWVSDATQLSHPLLPASHPALNFHQHQGLFHDSALCIRWPKY